MKSKLFVLLIVSFVGLQISVYSKGYDELGLSVPNSSEYSLEDMPSENEEQDGSKPTPTPTSTPLVNACLDKPNIPEQINCCIEKCVKFDLNPELCTKECTDHVNSDCSNITTIRKSKCCENECLQKLNIDPRINPKEKNKNPELKKCTDACTREARNLENIRLDECKKRCDEQRDKECTKNNIVDEKCIKKWDAAGGLHSKCLVNCQYPPPPPPPLSCEEATKKSCIDAKHQDTANWCKKLGKGTSWEDCCSKVADVCCKAPDYNGCKTYLPKEKTEEELNSPF